MAQNTEWPALRTDEERIAHIELQMEMPERLKRIEEKLDTLLDRIPYEMESRLTVHPLSSGESK